MQENFLRFGISWFLFGNKFLRVFNNNRNEISFPDKVLEIFFLKSVPFLDWLCLLCRIKKISSGYHLMVEVQVSCRHHADFWKELTPAKVRISALQNRSRLRLKFLNLNLHKFIFSTNFFYMYGLILFDLFCWLCNILMSVNFIIKQSLGSNLRKLEK